MHGCPAAEQVHFPLLHATRPFWLQQSAVVEHPNFSSATHCREETGRAGSRLQGEKRWRLAFRHLKAAVTSLHRKLTVVQEPAASASRSRWHLLLAVQQLEAVAHPCFPAATHCEFSRGIQVRWKGAAEAVCIMLPCQTHAHRLAGSPRGGRQVALAQVGGSAAARRRCARPVDRRTTAGRPKKGMRCRKLPVM